MYLKKKKRKWTWKRSGYIFIYRWFAFISLHTLARVYWNRSFVSNKRGLLFPKRFFLPVEFWAPFMLLLFSMLYLNRKRKMKTKTVRMMFILLQALFLFIFCKRNQIFDILYKPNAKQSSRVKIKLKRIFLKEENGILNWTTKV